MAGYVWLTWYLLCIHSASAQQLLQRRSTHDSLPAVVLAGGNVEKWLIDCEHAMRSTVKSVLHQSFNAYANRDRIKWLLEWPGQVRQLLAFSILLSFYCNFNTV